MPESLHGHEIDGGSLDGYVLYLVGATCTPSQYLYAQNQRREEGEYCDSILHCIETLQCLHYYKDSNYGFYSKCGEPSLCGSTVTVDEFGGNEEATIICDDSYVAPIPEPEEEIIDEESASENEERAH